MGVEGLGTRDWVLLPGTLCTGEVFSGFRCHGRRTGRAADAAPLGAFEEIEGLGHYALLEDRQSCAAATCAAEKVLS